MNGQEKQIRLDEVQVLHALAALFMIFHHSPNECVHHGGLPSGSILGRMLHVGASGVDIFLVTIGIGVWLSRGSTHIPRWALVPTAVAASACVSATPHLWIEKPIADFHRKHALGAGTAKASK